MICPHGHQSQADDFCDTCGAKIDAQSQPVGSTTTSAPTALTPATAPPSGQECPHCQTPNLPEALFCEACGYDFTTGALPRGAAAAVAAEPTPQQSRVAPSIALEWVAEVWVDPDWYSGQEAEEPMPSPGLPTVVPLTLRSNLVGRISLSRSIEPDVDCTSDTGVSRRHAQLTTDGTRWFVEDLGSANGTYVGPASGPLPLDPIAVGPRTELDSDDRVYVGAWTRIVVRRATPEEQSADA
ncbi:MAG: FHA domain-containing protein [Actinomycetota bacterium]|nr:FHA domain-containing protein [Actinomycetota bacterium]